MQIGVFLFCEFHNFLKDSQILKLKLTNVIDVTGTLAKEIPAK
jgi:hypothetical protein